MNGENEKEVKARREKTEIVNGEHLYAILALWTLKLFGPCIEWS